MNYTNATSIDEARAARGEYRAAGTDLQERLHSGIAKRGIVDISEIPGLDHIDVQDDSCTIGAFATVHDVGAQRITAATVSRIGTDSANNCHAADSQSCHDGWCNMSAHAVLVLSASRSRLPEKGRPVRVSGSHGQQSIWCVLRFRTVCVSASQFAGAGVCWRTGRKSK